MSTLGAGWRVRSEVSDAIDQVLAVIDNEAEPGGIVAVVHAGRTIHLSGYGLANLEAGWPWSAATLYDVASITKTMVAQAVVRMSDEGAMDLDADLRELVPTLRHLPLPVLVRHALSMRSGVRADEDLAWMAGTNGWVDEPFLHDLVARQRSLQFEPGAWQIYSDSNYRILARAVSRVRGQSFEDAMRSLVLDPLELRGTSIVTYDWIVGPGVATYYHRSDAGWSRQPYGYESSGDGAVRTSMSDLLRWLRLTLHDDHAGVPSIRRLVEEGRAVPAMPYRFGVSVDSYRGLPRWQHSGASGTAYAHYPDQDLTIAAFHNRADHPPWQVLDDLTDAALDALVPELPHDAKPPDAPCAPGVWVDPTTGCHVMVAPGGRLLALGSTGVVQAVDGRLLAQFGDAPSPLAVDDRGTLIADLGHGQVPFGLREPSEMPHDVEGTYRSDELGSSVSIRSGPDGDRLVLGRGQNHSMRLRLRWYGNDIAIADDLGLKVERETHGVVAIVLSTWGARQVRWEREGPPG